jgi:hypothetical protein
MKPKYNSYEEYVKEHLDFGKTDSTTSVLVGHPLLGVELLDRSTNKQQSLYHKFCKTEEEMAKSIAICEAIIDSGKIVGDLRIYVDYNPTYITTKIVSEMAKEYVGLTAVYEPSLGGSCLSVPKSVLLKNRKRKSFLLDVDSQSPTVLRLLESVLASFRVEVLLVNITKKGFHYVISPTDSYALEMKLQTANLSSCVSLKKRDGYLMYERDACESSYAEADERLERGLYGYD